MKRWSLDTALGLLALLTFAATRLIGLAQYPIFFFTDEAANSVLAAEFLDNGFRDQFGQLFPTYFQNGPSISLGTSVYAQLLPQVFWGQSVFATRAVSAIVALTGALAVGLIFKHIFKSRWWWTSILLLALTPAWFLHSRTAFEHPMWVAFFAWCLYFYLRYRIDQPRHLITAIIFGALSFYAYNGGQPGLAVMALLLLVIDWRYHWQQRRIVLIGLAIAALCALPYLRFQLAHGSEVQTHLQLLDSYWAQDLPLSEKLSRLANEYLYGLRPDYWYAPDNPRDLIRHQMKGYGNLLWTTLPFAILGLIIAVKNAFRRSTLTSTPSPSWGEGSLAPAYRVVLIALLVAPIGGVLVQANVLRDLVMVIPAALLTTIGLAALLDWIVRHAGSTQRTCHAVAVVVCAMLVFANFYILNDALTNGPTWYDNYGLTGLQYGSSQVFTAIRDHLKREPQTDVWLFPSWLNGAEMLKRYFTPNDPRVHLLNFDAFLENKYDLTDQTLLVMDRTSYQRLKGSSKFIDVQETLTLPLPDRSPGFYFVHARYAPDIDAQLTREREARQLLSREGMIVDGQLWWVAHSPLQQGSLQNLFDDRPETFVLTRNVNPIVIDITLPEARRVTGLKLLGGSHDLDLLIELYADGADQAGRYAGTFHQLRPGEPIDIEFDPPPGPVRRVRVTLTDLNQTTTGSVTLRDLALTIVH